MILGLDPGLATTGFGLLTSEGGNLSVVNYGVITTPAGMDTPSRLSMIRDDIEELIKLYKPTHVGIEKLFFQTNVKTAMVVAEARGVMVEAVHRAGLPQVEFTPLQVKQAVTGDGGADKLAVQRMVKLLLGPSIQAIHDDAADALAVAMATANQLNYLQRITDV